MRWEDLSDNAKDVMKDLGNFSPTSNAAYREVKGCMLRDDGEDGRTYYSSDDLRKIAEGCNEVADWLDKRDA